MLRSAPVAFLWTLMSLLRASLVRGTSAPLFAILLLFSSGSSRKHRQRQRLDTSGGQKDEDWPCVARLVMQPTALHWTSTFGESICRMRGSRPPSRTMSVLFSADGHKGKIGRQSGSEDWTARCEGTRTVDGQVAQRCTGGPLHLRIVTSQQEEHRVQRIPANLPDLLFRDLCKRKRSRSLQVDVVREGECCESRERGAGEEVCCRSVWRFANGTDV